MDDREELLNRLERELTLARQELAEAYEKAAKICDALAESTGKKGAAMAKVCANRIRALPPPKKDQPG